MASSAGFHLSHSFPIDCHRKSCEVPFFSPFFVHSNIILVIVVALLFIRFPRLPRTQRTFSLSLSTASFFFFFCYSAAARRSILFPPFLCRLDEGRRNCRKGHAFFLLTIVFAGLSGRSLSLSPPPLLLTCHDRCRVGRPLRVAGFSYGSGLIFSFFFRPWKTISRSRCRDLDPALLVRCALESKKEAFLFFFFPPFALSHGYQRRPEDVSALVANENNRPPFFLSFFASASAIALGNLTRGWSYLKTIPYVSSQGLEASFPSSPSSQGINACLRQRHVFLPRSD